MKDQEDPRPIGVNQSLAVPLPHGVSIPQTLPPTVVLGSPAGGSSSGITPALILRALLRGLPRALGLGLLLAALVGPAAFFLVPKADFTATAKLHVMAQAPVVLSRTVDMQDLTGESYKRFQQTQIAQVTSRLVLNTALATGNIAKLPMLRKQEDPIEWLRSKLDVGFVSGSEILSISLSGDDPQGLADIVNAIQEAYIEEVVNRDHKLRLTRQDTLKKLKDQATEMLRTKREAMRRLAEMVGSDDRQTVALKQQFAMEHLASIEKELLEVQSQKRRVEVELKTYGVDPAEGPGTGNGGAIPVAEVEQLVARDPGVQQLKERLTLAEAQYEAAAEKVRKTSRQPTTDPTLRVMREQAASIRKAVANREAQLRAQVIEQMQKGRAVVDRDSTPISHAAELQRQLLLFAELESQLQKESNQLRSGNQTLTTNTLELQGMQDEVAQIQATYNKISAEVEALNVEIQAPKRINKMEDAVVPRAQNNLKRYMMIGGMTFGSFGLGVMAIVLFELRKRTIDSADEVALGLGIDLVGALPRLPARTRKRGLVDGTKDDFWRNLLRESIDITRTVLLHAARNRSYRVVMVTSAISGEGKTSLSSHLAISMARCGLKTLLIDADLRRPSVQLLFDLPKTPGLADILRGSHDLEQCVSSCHFENLDVLTAGEIDQRCLRALSAGRIATLFEEVKQNYDFVIVDSSPVLQVADSLLVAPHADAVIFSIIQDVSRTPKVIAAYQKLQSVGVRILGAVVASSSGDLYSNDHYRYAGRSYYSATVGEASDPSGHEEPKVFPS